MGSQDANIVQRFVYTNEYVGISMQVKSFASCSWRAFHIGLVVDFKKTLVETPKIRRKNLTKDDVIQAKMYFGLN